MTYRELFYKATRLIDKGDITLGEYEEMTKPLDREIEQKLILDKIRDEILCNIVEDDTSGNIPNRLRADWSVANKAHMIDIAIIDKYRTKSEKEE